jgi:DNA-directed RNA polymerase specialized sigma24 family protein
MESDVRRAMRGDRAAFAALYHSRVRPVRATLSCLTGDPDPSSDAVASVFERAWRALPNLHEPAQFDAWLLGIVGDVARGIVSIDGRPARGEGAGLDDSVADLARAVRQLPIRLRDIVLLRTLFQMSVERAALVLKTTPAEVAKLEREVLETLTSGG